MIDHVVTIISLILIGLIVLVLIRALLGPTIVDRIVAVNVIGTKSMILLLLIGILFHRLDMFIDIAIAYSLLNFIASIAAARYLVQSRTFNPEDQ